MPSRKSLVCFEAAPQGGTRPDGMSMDTFYASPPKWASASNPIYNGVRHCETTRSPTGTMRHFECKMGEYHKGARLRRNFKISTYKIEHKKASSWPPACPLGAAIPPHDDRERHATVYGRIENLPINAVDYLVRHFLTRYS